MVCFHELHWTLQWRITCYNVVLYPFGSELTVRVYEVCTLQQETNDPDLECPVQSKTKIGDHPNRPIQFKTQVEGRFDRLLTQ